MVLGLRGRGNLQRGCKYNADRGRRQGDGQKFGYIVELHEPEGFDVAILGLSSCARKKN
jgi:hypothetical protein